MPLSSATIERHRRMARELVEETHRHDGLAPIDLARFWADQEIAIADPWGTQIPQLPFGCGTTGM